MIEFTALGKPSLLTQDYTEHGAIVAFKMWYDVSDPDKSKRLQYGAWIKEEDYTEELLDKLLLDFARQAFLPHIKAEMEKVFGK